MVGLVGATGAGKSTLSLLLCRFHDPDEGVILLDGRDIRDYRLDDVRNQFSLVFQDTFLFSTTIWQNIAYGRPDASYEEVIHAASVAHAHRFITEMPEGYDTVVGERGVTLSGGQRQRLSIARAILRRPSFLILDACTSALDAITEQAIQDSLRELRETSTVIVIAQRYSSVADADYVYVLDNGRIIETGPPDELNVPGTAFSRTLHVTEPLE
jgi:ABC-type multidrug transport system fused ATPase/permease subunit